MEIVKRFGIHSDAQLLTWVEVYKTKAVEAFGVAI